MEWGTTYDTYVFTFDFRCPRTVQWVVVYSVSCCLTVRLFLCEKLHMHQSNSVRISLHALQGDDSRGTGGNNKTRSNELISTLPYIVEGTIQAIIDPPTKHPINVIYSALGCINQRSEVKGP